MVSAVLQHVSGPRQPLDDAGRLLHRQFLYPFLLHHQKRRTLILKTALIDHKTRGEALESVTFFPSTSSSHSDEPDRLSGQRSAEAPGGGALRGGDGGPHRPGVRPDPGGADGAAGTAAEEESAGGCVCAASPGRRGVAEGETD